MNTEWFSGIDQRDIAIKFANPTGSDPTKLTDVNVDLHWFQSSQIIVLSTVAGNVTGIWLSGSPANVTNGGGCDLHVGGNVSGTCKANNFLFLGVDGSLYGTIRSYGNTTGALTFRGTSNHTGNIYAAVSATCTGDYSISDVNLPNATFLGNICTSQLTPGSTNVPAGWQITFGACAQVCCQSVTAAPTVSNVTSNKTNGAYKAGEVIDVSVQFSQTVNVTGTPHIQLETGTTDQNVNYNSGSGSSVLVFNYTAQAGDTSGDLDYTGTGALSLNGGTIRNSCDTNAMLTLPAPGQQHSLGYNKDLVIDTAAPTILWTMPLDNCGIRGLPWVRVAFDEAVSFADGHGAGDLTVNDSEATDCAGSEATYDFTGFDAPSGSVSVALAAGSFKDAAGNVFAGADWDYTFTTCHTPPQDADGDGDVDLGDFLILQGCFNGPNRPWKASGNQAACACLDDDLDLDVDLADFGVFQGCFNGPNVPPAASCQGGDLLLGGGGMLAVVQVGAETDTLTPSCSLEGREAAFFLSSPVDGEQIARGTPVAWQVDALLSGLSPGLAEYAFDIELRHDSETGALARAAIGPPEMLNPLSDELGVWWTCGPNGTTPGRLTGVGDAVPVPWLASYAGFLGAMPGAGSASNGTPVDLSAGSIDTSSLAPGRYVLLIRPTSATVLRGDVPLTTDLTGNFAVRAIPVTGSRPVQFVIAPS